MSIRLIRGALSTARSVHYLAGQAGLRRCSIRHVHLAAARHHLPPFTTLIYLIVYTPGIGLTGWEWLWVILAGLFDIGQWVASYSQRNEIPGMQRG